MLIALFTVAIMAMVFIALYGFVRAKIVPQKQFNERLRSIDSRSEEEQREAKRKVRKKNEIPSFKERVILPVLSKSISFLSNLAPKLFLGDIEKLLVIAGKSNSWSVEGYAVFRAFMMVLCFAGSFYYVSNHPEIAKVQAVVGMILAAVAGAVLPLVALRQMANKRQKKMLRQLPEVFDLLTISVQAGLAFDAALKRIVDRMEGPLIDEFSKLLDDMRIGLPRRQALRMLANRCDLPEMSLFATAVIQAERLGTGLGRTLSNQSTNMRERRRQQVKAEAMKAPVKMLLPLILFIFPAIFVVTVLPAVLGLLKNLSN